MATEVTETQEIRRVKHYPLKRIVPIDADHYLQLNDDIIYATLSANANLYLSIASVDSDDDYLYSSIIDITNDVDSLGNLTITPIGSAKIGGNDELVLYPRDSVKLFFDGINWNVLSEHRPSFSYTPTLYNTTNIASSTAYECFVLRNGNVVHVSGKVVIDLSGNGEYELGISLPIDADFSTNYDCVGVGVGMNSPKDVLYIKADAINNRATLHGDDNDAGSHEHFFNFTYKIS